MTDNKKPRYTPAQKKAAEKYLHESVEDVRIRVPKGQKAIIKSHADGQGESMNQFVIRAINETMRRDNQHAGPGLFASPAADIPDHDIPDHDIQDHERQEGEAAAGIQDHSEGDAGAGVSDPAEGDAGAGAPDPAENEAGPAPGAGI